MRLKVLGTNQTVVKFNDGREVFFSYNTPVAGWLPQVGYFRTETRWSSTTTRHINKYLAGNKAVNASQSECNEIGEVEQNYIFLMDNDEPLYWNSQYGWVERRKATPYTDEQRETLQLPTGGRWVCMK